MAFIAPATVITALAFFFGWTRTDAIFSYFGVSSTVLGYSTQDYLIRSVDGFFTPLVIMIVVGITLVLLHGVVVSALEHGRHRGLARILSSSLILTGAGLLLYGLLFSLGREPLEVYYLLAPLSPGLGIGCLSYGLLLIQLFGGHLHRQTESVSSVRWFSIWSAMLTIVLIVLSLFWTVAVYARNLGTQRAEVIAAGLSDQPGVVVYSKEELGIGQVGLGVVGTTEQAPDTKFHFRYSGLRLLTKTDGKYYLLPEQWTRENGIVIVLPDSSDLLIEYSIHKP